MLTLFTKTCLSLALSLGAGPAALTGELGATSAASSQGYVEQIAAIAQLSNVQLEQRVNEDLGSLGSMSIGLPNNGRQLNPTQAKDSHLLEVVAPDFAWGTQETLDYIKRAVRAVHLAHPETQPLHVGHISKKSGGYLSPHLSHQSGRDVDLGYYYKAKRTWYRRATASTLDVERTWTLVKALITETDVDMLLIDVSIQHLLRQHAEAIGEDPTWLHQIFKGDADRPRIIRHVRGHATHIHARFFNPVAQTLAQRAYPYLVNAELIEPVVVYTHHRAKKGDSLNKLARVYGTSVRAIQAANGLRGTTIMAKKVYKIPRKGGPVPVDKPFAFPDRRLPPHSAQ